MSEIVADLQEALEELANDPDWGRALVLRRDEGTIDQDAAKPWKGKVPAPVDYAVRGILMGYSRQEARARTIRRGDKKGLLSLKDLPIVPRETDLLFEATLPVPAEAQPWSIVDLELPELGTGETILAELQLRR